MRSVDLALTPALSVTHRLLFHVFSFHKKASFESFLQFRSTGRGPAGSSLSHRRPPGSPAAQMLPAANAAETLTKLPMGEISFGDEDLPQLHFHLRDGCQLQGHCQVMLLHTLLPKALAIEKNGEGEKGIGVFFGYIATFMRARTHTPGPELLT